MNCVCVCVYFGINYVHLPHKTIQYSLYHIQGDPKHAWVKFLTAVKISIFFFFLF